MKEQNKNKGGKERKNGGGGQEADVYKRFLGLRSVSFDKSCSKITTQKTDKLNEIY